MPKPLTFISVVGARPNFMKIAPFIHAVNAHNQRLRSTPATNQGSISNNERPFIQHTLVHTGQHYDERMSQSFFDALNIPRPNIDLEIGSGSHAEQVGNTMIAFEKVLQKHRPDWVIVVGDVNATCACSVTAKKEHIKLAHIEAGLRSFDLEMPEEINRMVTDRLSDLLFTTDEIATENLRNEGVPEEKIKRVGNIMIDTLEAQREKAENLDLADILATNRVENCSSQSQDHGVSPENSESLKSDVNTKNEEQNTYFNQPTTNNQNLRSPTSDSRPPTSQYALLTMHRPSNVDEKEIFVPIIRFLLDEVCADMSIIWPIHPRARKRLEEFNLWDEVLGNESMILLEPVGYHEMLRLNIGATLMLTDSGGLQEECCVLGTPCMTLRWNTERPVTLKEHGGASILVGNKVENLRTAYTESREHPRKPQRPDLWDGRTAERIVETLAGKM